MRSSQSAFLYNGGGVYGERKSVFFNEMESGRQTTLQWVAPNPLYMGSTNWSTWVIKNAKH